MKRYTVYCECNKMTVRFVPAFWIYVYLYKHMIWHNHDCTWWPEKGRV